MPDHSAARRTILERIIDLGETAILRENEAQRLRKESERMAAIAKDIRAEAHALRLTFDALSSAEDVVEEVGANG